MDNIATVTLINDTADLLKARGKTHGDWKIQAKCAHELKTAFHRHANLMSPDKHEAVEMILTKLSRIAVGNASEPDHWDDIAGYAKLGRPDSPPTTE